jgi:hypothetical protein
MSDQFPPSAAPSQPTEQPEPSERPGRSTRRLAIIGVAAVVVLALAGGAFAAYQKLDGGGTQPHDVLPDSLVAYARVDVDPSAGQKIALLKLIRKFPEAAEEIGITSAGQDVRELLVRDALEAAGCDLTYDKDVKPWLGSRLGIGVDDQQHPLAAIQVTDEDKAERGIKRLFACADEKAALAFLDGYAIVAEDQKTADAAADAAAEAPLADAETFTQDTGALGEQGVASGWVDTDRLATTFPELEDAMSEASPTELAQLQQAGSAAFALRTDGSTLELAGISGTTDAFEVSGPAPLSGLPSDTVAAIAIGGLGSQVADQYELFLDQLSTGLNGSSPEPGGSVAYVDGEPDDLVSGFEDATGLKAPEDLETLFGDGLTIAVGSRNLEKLPSLEDPADIASLDVALMMSSDPDRALDLARRLVRLASQAGVDLSATGTDDGAVLATNQEAAEALDGSGTLGDDDTFRSVMPYGDDTAYGLYVDVATILDTISKADPPADVAQDIEEARALKAVGLSYGEKDDEHTVFSLRVAFAE